MTASSGPLRMTHPGVTVAGSVANEATFNRFWAPKGWELDGSTGAHVGFEGVTTDGPPASGYYDAGDFVTTTSGEMWVCTASGQPGTWTQIVGGSLDGWNVVVLTSAEYDALADEAENTLYITTD